MEGVNKKLGVLGGDSVDVFKGIPFATAKTLENPERHPGWQGGCWALGAGRWALGAGCWALGWPWLVVFTPYPSLTVGTLKATDFKKRCLQATITQDNTFGQEDCLYLNIWVPQSKKQGLHPSFPKDPTPPHPTPELQALVWVSFGAAKLNGSEISTEARRGAHC